MDQNIKSTLLRALSRERGDDLIRAQHAFHNMTPQQMKEEHGCSGKTRQQILDSYQQHTAEVDRAIGWVKNES